MELNGMKNEIKNTIARTEPKARAVIDENNDTINNINKNNKYEHRNRNEETETNSKKINLLAKNITNDDCSVNCIKTYLLSIPYQ